MAYIISEDAKDLLSDIKKFCDNEVKEQCKEFDKTGEWPKDIYDKAIEQGYTALEVPEEYGGIGLSRVDIAALMEEMAIADAGFATTISASGLGMKPVLIAGSEELKKKACDMILDGGFAAFCLTEPGAGSDASAGKTTAVKDGDSYILNGRKCFITNAEVADFYCITAMTDKSAGVKGISMFFVEKGTPGLSTGNHEDKMGIRTSNTADVVLEDCRIPASNLIGKETMAKFEEIMNAAKLNDLLKKREEEESKKNTLVWVFALLGAVVCIAGIAYAVYRFMNNNQDEYDDFDDDFEDDFFDEEEAE